MFTEQPAPPPQVTEVQIQRADAASSQPAPAASPEVLAPSSAPATPIADSPVVVDTVPPSQATPVPVEPQATQPTITSTAQAERKQEVEQTLLELTSKARAKQKEQQEQQAAAEAAKYAESGELEEAEKVINNPALPANVRAALLKQLQAKQAKKGKSPLLTKKEKRTPVQAAKQPGNTTGVGSSGYSSASRDYTAAPIVPFTQAQMRLRMGQLFGRNLNFAFPLSIPAPITSLFGWRIHPISGSPRFHRGIDFGAPTGTPIVAAKAGQVETASELDGYGLTVIVRHANTHQTLYGHMSQIFVKPGEVVKKGQLLGLVGSTGNSTGPHLHFEVHELSSDGWVALDPAIALDGAITLAQNSQDSGTTSDKPRSFNLAMSGLLDINPPIQTLSAATFGNTFLASLMPQTSIAPTSNSFTSTGEVLLPLTLLPTAIPELGLLISPLVENLAAELSIPLPGIESLSKAVSFNPVPALANLPQPVAFDPKMVLPTPSAMRLATTKPLAGLTIQEQVTNTLPLPRWQQPSTAQTLPAHPVLTNQQQLTQQNLPAPPVLTNQQKLALQRLTHRQLQLGNKRIKPLDGG